MDFIGSGRETADEKVATNKPKTFLVDGAEVSTDAKTRIFQGIKNVFIGGFSSIGIFEISYWLMSNLNVPFIFESFVALLFSVVAIKMWDGTTGRVPTLLKSVVTGFTVIIFVLSLFIGFNQGRGVSSGNLDHILLTCKEHDELAQKTAKEKSEKNETKQTSFSEFGIIKSVDQVWKTTKVFKAGSRALVKIRGAAVRMANGDVLTPCDYSIQITDNEPLIFTATKNITTTIEVIY